MSVCEIEELEGYAFLVGCTAQRGEEHMYESCVAGTFVETVVLKGGERDGGI